MESHSTDATTAFTSDAQVVSASVAKPFRMSNIHLSSSSTDVGQTIVDFLKKPTVLQTGVFSSTDTVSTFSQAALPFSILNNALVSAKVSGFLGFRATTVLRLQVNANKFQQGRYMLCFTHIGGTSSSSTAGSSYYSYHTNTLTARTQLPRIELDLACDTEGIIRIPFTSCMNYFSLRALTSGSLFGTVGVAQIFPYVALTAPTGSSTCAFTLF